MCGVVGAWTVGDPTPEALKEAVCRGADAIAHRGPDASGVWVDPKGDLALAFRRLAILDLSPAGNQPMASASGRWTIVFNGEIYNHRALRAELEREGLVFRGHSDTEVLVNAIDRWGIERTLTRADGMFGFAAWDGEQRSLVLARDRFGEKPLYWWSSGIGHVVFGSEIGALRAIGVPIRLSRDHLTGFLAFGYSVALTSSVFEGVHKVEPGTFVRFESPLAGPVANRYWSLPIGADPGHQDPDIGEVEATLLEAVESRSHSDRPLGAFLSGGVDSTIVVALLRKVVDAPVETFTVGFEEAGVDESGHARAVATALGCSHRELVLRSSEAAATVPALARTFDEPFADPSSIPMVLVSRLAAEHVTVVLSGDGADELFGGYERYRLAPRAWSVASRIPSSLRASRAASWAASASLATATRAPAGAARARAARTARAVQLMGSRDGADLYRRLIAQWPDPEHLVVGGRRAPTPFDERMPMGLEAGMMAVDAGTYLPGDILTKVDRATMAASIEARAPFLDPCVAEIAWKFGPSTRTRGRGKAPLWSVLERLVPRTLVDRPKQGFALPLRDWLRGPLCGWADDLLQPSVMDRQGFLRSSVVSAEWDGVRSGAIDSPYGIWTVLMLQSWLDEVGESAGLAPWNGTRT